MTKFNLEQIKYQLDAVWGYYNVLFWLVVEECILIKVLSRKVTVNFNKKSLVSLSYNFQRNFVIWIINKTRVLNVIYIYILKIAKDKAFVIERSTMDRHQKPYTDILV